MFFLKGTFGNGSVIFLSKHPLYDILRTCLMSGLIFCRIFAILRCKNMPVIKGFGP